MNQLYENIKKVNVNIDEKPISKAAKSFLSGVRICSIRYLILKFIQLDPEKRFAHVQDIQSHPFFAPIDWNALAYKRGPPIIKIQERKPIDLARLHFDPQAPEDPAALIKSSRHRSTPPKRMNPIDIRISHEI
jgi:hypothetical protein